MPRSLSFAFAMLLPLLSASARADEAADKAKAQKKTAEENWGSLEIGEAAQHETAHLLILAPKAMQKKLKEIGNSLEKHHELARKALEFEGKTEPWRGKLTVYLFSEKEAFASFVRKIETRQLDSGEVGSRQVEGDAPHVAAGPPRGKRDPNVEVQAAQQVAAALLQKKIGAKVPLPDWVLTGFGRATTHRAAPSDQAVKTDKIQASKLSRLHKAGEIWTGGLDAEDAEVLSASFMDYLAYGPGKNRFVRFVEGFKPEENVVMKTAADAFKAAGWDPDFIDKKWREWAR